MKYQVIRDTQTHAGFVIVNMFGDRRGTFTERGEALARCMELNAEAEEWKRKADEALDDFNYVGSRHHY